MGLGGNLIWTSVFDAIHDQFGDVAVACDTPMITDVLAGYWYRRDTSYQNDLIFRGNPDIAHVSIRPKNRICKFIDAVFEKLVSVDRLRRAWERFVISRVLINWRSGGAPLLLHIDMRCHSYAERQTSKKTYWKTGGCAAHVIARTFGAAVTLPRCKIFPSQDEREKVQKLLDEISVSERFIVIEPETNRDWFGELRAWRRDNWQSLVLQLGNIYPDTDIVQVGVGNHGPLEGVKDLTGKTSFREVAALLGEAGLFIGTEGGLMHLAAAAATPSVILWGGITLPEFAGYPHQHRILCHYVDCAPCGNLGWCDHGRKCMDSIQIDEVLQAVRAELA